MGERKYTDRTWTAEELASFVFAYEEGCEEGHEKFLRDIGALEPWTPPEEVFVVMRVRLDAAEFSDCDSGVEVADRIASSIEDVPELSSALVFEVLEVSATPADYSRFGQLTWDGDTFGSNSIVERNEQLGTDLAAARWRARSASGRWDTTAQAEGSNTAFTGA